MAMDFDRTAVIETLGARHSSNEAALHALAAIKATAVPPTIWWSASSSLFIQLPSRHTATTMLLDGT